MKTLYIECNMGAAGDMLMAAFMELLPNPEEFIEKLNSLGIKDVKIKAESAQKCGIYGHRIDVSVCGKTEDSIDVLDNENHHHHNHIHSHSSLNDITSLINSLNLPNSVKEKSCMIYSLIGQAESHVHNHPVEHIHFHEVGTIDAVCDIVGCCLALDIIAPERVIVSPIHVGCGNVKCQHGILPVPAPATAYILRDVPIYSGEIKGELCTPTGAAIIKAIAHSFGAMPVMSVEKIGYGMGKKDFERANCVRAFLGESNIDNCDSVFEISCNLDDITAEELAFSYDFLFDAGALDVFSVPITMKKGRMGYMLTAIVTQSKKDQVAKAMLKHTSTRGVRMSHHNRLTLDSSYHKVETEYGEITIKESWGYGIKKAKPEYECVAAAAKKHGVSFSQVQRAAMKSFDK